MKTNWPDQKEGVNASIIVAHPDDETIFCGGTMLTCPKWNWQIVCVTMQTNTSRPQEFDAAMHSYRNYGVNINSYKSLNKEDVVDRDLTAAEINDWKDSIRQLNLTPNIVFTHNEMGEYGHNHHIELSRIVRGLFTNVWEFVYPGDDKISPQPTKLKIKKIILSEDILDKKSKIFDRCYVSQIMNTWDLLPGLMEYEMKSGPEIFTSGA